MEVRGKAIKTIPIGIKNKFGEESLQQWLEKITPQAREVYSSKINDKAWYPLKEILVEPMANIAHLFYKWDLEKAGWEFGEFSANSGIKGAYRLVFKTLPPAYFISKAVKILPSYYRPSAIQVLENKKGSAVFRITEFPEIDKTTEFRVAGWMLMALKINGQITPKVEITKLLSNKDPYTEYHLSWLTA
ncbi:MAG: hypothetical protein KAW12_10205 [Candidatus Aminicenantes bacterium]|nr:hypothetical protein [Candidatus Aminicenantes bacterium]